MSNGFVTSTWHCQVQETVASSPRLVIIEGFILFADPRVIEIADALILVTFDLSEKAIATDRRVSRVFRSSNPESIDPRKRKQAEFLGWYFEDVVWTEAVKHPEYILPPGWNKPTLKVSRQILSN
jgi:hypothetical protein